MTTIDIKMQSHLAFLNYVLNVLLLIIFIILQISIEVASHEKKNSHESLFQGSQSCGLPLRVTSRLYREKQRHRGVTSVWCGMGTQT